MNRTVRRVLALALIAVLLPVHAFSKETENGEIPPTGIARPGEQINGWDGTAHRALKSDPSGILRTTEEYPFQLQNEVFVAASAVAVTTGLKQIGNGWSVSPFGDRVVRIRRVATGGNAVGSIHLHLFGSDDNVNFYPLGSAAAWRTGVLADSAFVDTLTAMVPQGNATLEMKLTLPSDIVYPGRYLAVWAQRDSVSGSAQALTVIFEGRYK